MTRTTIAKLSLACLISAAAVTLAVTPAVAAPGPTPSGFTGACNMLNDTSMGTIPMVKNTLHGNGSNGDAGMFHAVAVSRCG
jgi:hypothetical protein